MGLQGSAMGLGRLKCGAEGMGVRAGRRASWDRGGCEETGGLRAWTEGHEGLTCGAVGRIAQR